VGPLHPVAEGFLEREAQNVSWCSFGAYKERAGGTRKRPYIPASTDRTLLKVIVKSAPHTRSLLITHPTLVEALIKIGAAYEFALGAGTSAAVIAWLISQGKCRGAGQVVIGALSGDFAKGDRPGDEISGLGQAVSDAENEEYLQVCI
ncbi:unnamed protein product, partial [Polarella glacialis]